MQLLRISRQGSVALAHTGPRRGLGRCRGSPCPFTRRRATARSTCSSSICKTAPTCTSASIMTARPSTLRERPCPARARPRATPSPRRTPFPAERQGVQVRRGQYRSGQDPACESGRCQPAGHVQQGSTFHPSLVCWHVVAARSCSRRNKCVLVWSTAPRRLSFARARGAHACGRR